MGMRPQLLIPFLALVLALAPVAGCKEVGKFAAKKVVSKKATREAATRTGREVSERMTVKPLTGLLDHAPRSPGAYARPTAPLARMAAPSAAIPEERAWKIGVDVPAVVPEPETLQQLRQQEQQAQWEMELHRQQQQPLQQAPYNHYAPYPR
jgi:hypothetical protein